jgi:hypothetical protein
LPGFSRASASCHIEAELDSTLLNDAEGIQIVVQRAYQSCEPSRSFASDRCPLRRLECTRASGGASGLA